MYLFFGIFFALCVIFYFLNYWRKKRIIKKICKMNQCEKIQRLNHLAEPFGFFYLPKQDIISSRINAWQREFGYHSLFDKSAPHFNMVFDCQPIYFNYQNRTWMIELWKGQYGINTGSEVGVYQADKILTPEEFDRTLFHSVPNDKLLRISSELFQKGHDVFSIKYCHWWLTGFQMGHYSEPEDLVMQVSIQCLDYEMLSCLVESLLHSGYNDCEITVCDLTVSFVFSTPHSKQPRFDSRFSCWLSSLQNRLFCWLYRWITRPFSCTLDQLLYLYYSLPFAFRHMFLFKRNRKQKMRRKRKYYR